MRNELHKSRASNTTKTVYLDVPDEVSCSSDATREPSLLERIAAGDQLAVQACLDQYGNLIWSLARRYLGSSHDAEDAVQEIFVEVWSCAKRYKPGIASEATFVATIARRRLIDRIRKKGRMPDIDSMTNDEGGQFEPPVNGCLEEATDVQLVARMLKDMDAQTREVLSMSLGDGYTHTEIAAQTGLPLGTVKTRVRRGLIKIRQQLETLDELPECCSG